MRSTYPPERRAGEEDPSVVNARPSRSREAPVHRFRWSATVVAVGACAVTAWAGSAARAQSGIVEEHIPRYDVSIAVQRNGTLLVTERIAYDFGSFEHHGIIREIPVVFRYDQTFDR